MNKYHIRFNTQHNGSGLNWRVFENGVGNLVRSFKITAPTFDEISVENGIEKWNVCCYGHMTITDECAVIR
jgi:hypothetical protein